MALHKYILILLAFVSVAAYGQNPLSKLIRKKAAAGDIPGYTLTYSNGFNGGTDIDPEVPPHEQYGNGTLSDVQFVEGIKSFNSVPANVSGSWRSEVQFDASRTTDEGIITYWVYYDNVLQNSCHSFQFHPETEGGSASPGLWHIDGEFQLLNWVEGINTSYATNYVIPEDTWIFIRHDFKFGAAGYWKITINEVVVLNETNIQVGDGSGQYLKIGLNYFGAGTPASSIFFDGLMIYDKD